MASEQFSYILGVTLAIGFGLSALRWADTWAYRAAEATQTGVKPFKVGYKAAGVIFITVGLVMIASYALGPGFQSNIDEFLDEFFRTTNTKLFQLIWSAAVFLGVILQIVFRKALHAFWSRPPWCVKYTPERSRVETLFGIIIAAIAVIAILITIQDFTS